jgi:predicted permease
MPVSDDEPVVVLSHAAWRDRFAGAGDVIGQPVSVDGHAFVIAGVAPPGFRGTVPGLSMDLWLPHEAYPPGSLARTWVVPFGRLADGVERKSAQSVVNVIGLRIPPDEAHTVVRRVGLETLGGLPREQGGRHAASLVAVLVATAVLVLLIACGNIAGMLLARAVARRREIAVRLAVGATRGRLIRQLLTETLALFLAGGALGVLMAFGATRAMAGVRPPVPDLGLAFDFVPDGRVLGLALVVTVATAIVFGLAPALGATRPRLVPALKDGAGSGGRQGARARSAFVVGQLALAVWLLVVAGLLVRSLRNGLAVDPGFGTAGVVVAATNLAPHGYDEARGRAFQEQLVARVAALPGVEATALAEWVLLAGARGRGQDVRAADAAPDGPAPTAWFSAVDTAYFGTLRIPLIAGRGFTAADRPGSAPVVVVNQTLAQRLWPDGGAIGRRLRAGPTAYEVIGIARDGKYTSVNERPQPVAFFPYAQTYAGRMALHVRTRGGTAETVRGIRDQVQALDPNVAVEGAGSLRQMVNATLFPQRFVAGLVALLGLLGLLLSAVGVYGVLMYSVTQRIREFGIRVALGASAGAVTRGVVAHGAKLAAGGAVLGLAGAAAVTRVLRFWLIGVGPLDPVTFVSVPCILAAVSLLAVYHPVRRALRADPLQAMRAE